MNVGTDAVLGINDVARYSELIISNDILVICHDSLDQVHTKRKRVLVRDELEVWIVLVDRFHIEQVSQVTKVELPHVLLLVKFSHLFEHLNDVGDVLHQLDGLEAIENLLVVHGCQVALLIQLVVVDAKLTLWIAHITEEWQVDEHLIVDWQAVQGLLAYVLQDSECLINRENLVLALGLTINAVIDLEGGAHDCLDNDATEAVVERVQLGLRELGDVVPIFLIGRIADVEVEVVALLERRRLALVFDEKLRSCDLVNHGLIIDIVRLDGFNQGHNPKLSDLPVRLLEDDFLHADERRLCSVLTVFVKLEFSVLEPFDLEFHNLKSELLVEEYTHLVVLIEESIQVSLIVFVTETSQNLSGLSHLILPL